MLHYSSNITYILLGIIATCIFAVLYKYQCNLASIFIHKKNKTLIEDKISKQDIVFLDFLAEIDMANLSSYIVAAINGDYTELRYYQQIQDIIYNNLVTIEHADIAPCCKSIDEFTNTGLKCIAGIDNQKLQDRIRSRFNDLTGYITESEYYKRVGQIDTRDIYIALVRANNLVYKHRIAPTQNQQRH